MLSKRYNLLDAKASSLSEVVAELNRQKTGSSWAQFTNDWAITQVMDTTQVHGDFWYKGLLPKEMFSDILFPEHYHKLPDGSYIFPPNTLITEALAYYAKADQLYIHECIEHLAYLKSQIQSNGFTTAVVLAVINGELRHHDGLHRLLALMMLLKEGYEYRPIPVFLHHNPLT